MVLGAFDSLESYQYTFSANTWLEFYVRGAIYGHFVWAWKESLLTPTHGEFYVHEECLTE